MRRLSALALVVVLVVAIVTPAHAGVATGVAIGLGSLFLFSALVAPFAYPYPHVVYGAPVVYASPVVYSAPVVRAPVSQPTVAYPAPAPAVVRIVQYPHGRYELHGDGVTTAYQWIWVATAAPTPPPSAGSPPSALPPSGSTE